MSVEEGDNLAVALGVVVRALGEDPPDRVHQLLFGCRLRVSGFGCRDSGLEIRVRGVDCLFTESRSCCMGLGFGFRV